MRMHRTIVSGVASVGAGVVLLLASFTGAAQDKGAAPGEICSFGMDESQAVPPSGNVGTGTVSLGFDPFLQTPIFDVTHDVAGATRVVLRIGAPTDMSSGDPEVVLDATGSMDFSKALTPSEILAIQPGFGTGLYVAVESGTPGNEVEEIRGAIDLGACFAPTPVEYCQWSLDESQVNPPSGSIATGTATLTSVLNGDATLEVTHDVSNPSSASLVAGTSPGNASIGIDLGNPTSPINFTLTPLVLQFILSTDFQFSVVVRDDQGEVAIAGVFDENCKFGGLTQLCSFQLALSDQFSMEGEADTLDGFGKVYTLSPGGNPIIQIADNVGDDFVASVRSGPACLLGDTEVLSFGESILLIDDVGGMFRLEIDATAQAALDGAGTEFFYVNVATPFGSLVADLDPDSCMLVADTGEGEPECPVEEGEPPVFTTSQCSIALSDSQSSSGASGVATIQLFSDGTGFITASHDVVNPQTFFLVQGGPNPNDVSNTILIDLGDAASPINRMLTPSEVAAFGDVLLVDTEGEGEGGSMKGMDNVFLTVTSDANADGDITGEVLCDLEPTQPCFTLALTDDISGSGASGVATLNGFGNGTGVLTLDHDVVDPLTAVIVDGGPNPLDGNNTIVVDLGDPETPIFSPLSMSEFAALAEAFDGRGDLYVTVTSAANPDGDVSTRLICTIPATVDICSLQLTDAGVSSSGNSGNATVQVFADDTGVVSIVQAVDGVNGFFLVDGGPNPNDVGNTVLIDFGTPSPTNNVFTLTPSQVALFDAAFAGGGDLYLTVTSADNPDGDIAVQVLCNEPAFDVMPVTQTDITAFAGQDLSLQVGVFGNTIGNVQFQWFFDPNSKGAEMLLVGENQPVLQLVSVQPEDSGMYFCEATDELDTVRSPAFSLAVEIPPAHDGDTDEDFEISLEELTRVIQLFNSGEISCDDPGAEGESEDGYRPGPGDQSCGPHDSDFLDNGDFDIQLSELLRFIQLFNAIEYEFCPMITEDDYCPIFE